MQQEKIEQFSIRLLRNATLVVDIEGTKFLVDPMLGKKGAWDPIPWTNEVRNPTVDLPVSEEEVRTIIQEADYVLLTHLHPDHWDDDARRLIPKEKTIICQPEDVVQLNEQGFTNLQIGARITFSSGITLERVSAQHGHGELAEKMAPASGFILKTRNKVLYLAGDTVWFEGVQTVLAKWKPDVVVVNGGSAKFQFGDPITMTAGDVLAVANHSKAESKVIVVHLEAINHCSTTREELRQLAEEKGLSSKIFIPLDGEELQLHDMINTEVDAR